MKHFLSIDDLTHRDVLGLIQHALSFKTHEMVHRQSSQILCPLFYENSTRTRMSFELAARQLGMMVVGFDVQASSNSKGESLLDTLRTLEAMGVGIGVIRHSESGVLHALASQMDGVMHLVNAGDGQNEHPTQALLDLMTIMQQKPDLHALNIVVVGNVRHSRVAHSFQRLCALMGVQSLVFACPKVWEPQAPYFGEVTQDLDAVLQNADVVMSLRVQQERLQSHEKLDLMDYREDYGLTAKRLKHMKSDVMILHPGPINRGVEIDDAVADGPNSSILQQVQNGVCMRMAILDWLD